MKIYQYMKSLRLENVFFTQLILRLAAMMLGILAAFYFERWATAICVYSFSVYAFYHHFFCCRDLYKLRREYKDHNLSPEEAAEKYHADMCMIHAENQSMRTCWRVALLALVLSVLVQPMSVLAVICHIIFLAYEYKTTQFESEEF